MVKKSEQAYRNISETATILDLKAHVLRFWETKFDALQPMTRGGGRRYYSPDDIALLETIKDLVHERGMVIKDANILIDKYGTNAIYLAPEKESDDSSETSDLPQNVRVLAEYDRQLAEMESRALRDIANLNAMLEKLQLVAS